MGLETLPFVGAQCVVDHGVLNRGRDESELDLECAHDLVGGPQDLVRLRIGLNRQRHFHALSLERDSGTLARIRENAVFSVNLLSADQDSLTLLQGFVQPANAAKVEGRSVAGRSVRHDKLAGVDFRLAENGCPLLSDAMAWLTCEAEQFVTLGDHVLVAGKVTDGRVERSEEPMTSLYTGWTYSG